jgi:hypothetical protein
MKSLNQLIKSFSDFADAHGQINSFGVGDLWEVGMSTELQYPLLWIQPTETKIIKGEAETFAISTTKFRVFILDRVKKDETNEMEVLSDTTQIGHDLVKNIDQNPIFLSGNYTLNEEDVLMEYVTEKLKDEVSGVYMQMTFSYPFNSGCSTPLNS